jgi:hypothetical protein
VCITASALASLNGKLVNPLQSLEIHVTRFCTCTNEGLSMLASFLPIALKSLTLLQMGIDFPPLGILLPSVVELALVG